MARWILAHRRALVGVLVIVFVVSLSSAPFASHFINYGFASAGLPSSDQSVRVQNLLPAGQDNSTLTIVVPNLFASEQKLCQNTYNFTYGRGGLLDRGITDLASTVSICSVAASTVDYLYGNASSPNVRIMGTNQTDFFSLSSMVWGYPAKFLLTWEQVYGGLRSEINQTFNTTGGQPGYDDAVRASLYENYTPSETPNQMVQQSVASNALTYFNNATYGDHTTSKTLVVLGGVLLTGDVLSYANPTLVNTETATWLFFARNGSGPPPTAFGGDVVQAYAAASRTGGDPGWTFVRASGYSVDIIPGVPLVLNATRGLFVSPDGTIVLVSVVFSVSSSYIGAKGFVPAQAATPAVRDSATEYFGPGAGVTGAGAVAYDLQGLNAQVELILAATFILLLIATMVVLRSLWAGALSLLFVFLGLAGLGQVGILVSGLIFGAVPSTVSQLLEFLIIGLVTDYLVYMIYRYRQNLRRGLDPAQAVEGATGSAGFAILTSATIVAIGMITLSFVPGAEAFGPALALSVILTGISVAFFLPVLLSYIGPRTFLRPPTMTDAAPAEESIFYRFARVAMRRRVLVVVIAAVVAIPSVAFLLNAPTSYNALAGLPSTLPSVQAQGQITDAFGPSQISPTYVMVPAPPGESFCGNATCGFVNPATAGILSATAGDLNTTSGVSGANGPFIIGNQTYAPTSLNANRTLATSYLLQNGSWAYYKVYLSDDPNGLAAMHTVRTLRQNSTWLVGGPTAALVDQQNQNEVTYPIIYALIVALIGIVLGVAFRSVSFPLISLSGIFVSIGASFVLLWWISQYLLNQVVLFVIPLLLIVVLLSLGNDYTVFTLSRVAEMRRHYPKAEAIPRAQAESGAVVVSLGLMLAVSLGALAFGPYVILAQLGIVFVISLVVDTFLIIMFYFPAALSLFSRK